MRAHAPSLGLNQTSTIMSLSPFLAVDLTKEVTYSSAKYRMILEALHLLFNKSIISHFIRLFGIIMSRC